MDKALSEMNTKELFCALTGEYGPIRQAYVQTAFRKYKEQHGEYADLTEMIRAAVSGELGVMRRRSMTNSFSMPAGMWKEACA